MTDETVANCEIKGHFTAVCLGLSGGDDTFSFIRLPHWESVCPAITTRITGPHMQSGNGYSVSAIDGSIASVPAFSSIGLNSLHVTTLAANHNANSIAFTADLYPVPVKAVPGSP